MKKAVLIDSLERILNWLQQNCPSYAARFLPGLSFEKIEEKLSNLPFKLPREVYELYHWHNGTNIQSCSWCFIYHSFCDLDRALLISDFLNESEWLEMRKEDGEPVYLFPIFEFDGEFFAVQGNITEVETAPVFHIAAECSGISLAFNSLATMMLAIAESYETGVYNVTSEGEIEWNDMEKSRLIRLKYNPGTTERLYSDGG